MKIYKDNIKMYLMKLGYESMRYEPSGSLKREVCLDYQIVKSREHVGMRPDFRVLRSVCLLL